MGDGLGLEAFYSDSQSVMLSTGLKYGPISIDYCTYCMSTIMNMTMAESSSLTIFVKISIIM